MTAIIIIMTMLKVTCMNTNMSMSIIITIMMLNTNKITKKGKLES
jgi:hypothetical protein